MGILPNILFVLALILGIGYFARNIRKIIRNIRLGRAADVTGPSAERWKNMARIALGQQKMVVRPVSGFLHIIVYLGFIIINLSLIHI